MPKGTVKWFDPKKGYGFITPDDVDEKLFVHRSNIIEPDEHLRPGDRVTFDWCKRFSIVVDSSVDADQMAKFLAELAEVYGELSSGDELVIKEGRIPAGSLVCK